MLTGVAFPPGRLPRSFPGFPGAWLFVFIIILLIALIFTRVYAGGDRSGRVTGHRSRRRTAHRAGRGPERGGNHGHRNSIQTTTEPAVTRKAAPNLKGPRRGRGNRPRR